VINPSWNTDIRLIDVWMASRVSSLSLKRSGRSQVRLDAPAKGLSAGEGCMARSQPTIKFKIKYSRSLYRIKKVVYWVVTALLGVVERVPVSRRDKKLLFFRTQFL